jgi:hypothetical protein
MDSPRNLSYEMQYHSTIRRVIGLSRRPVQSYVKEVIRLLNGLKNPCRNTRTYNKTSFPPDVCELLSIVIEVWKVAESYEKCRMEY